MVLSNRPGVYGLERAQQAGIKTETLDHKNYGDREAFDADLRDKVASYKPDLVCLAGFMRVLTPVFIEAFTGRLLNIHPSLLPDYKGLHTHERALADGRTEAGCTVHYVVPELDSGEMIVKRRVPILPGDTPDLLAERVLEQEHIAYPEAVRIVAKKLGL